mmetsp:Transcript_51752/g.123162  ORF Transcript_51752/g.123162 Transcript_51752/m.123162 type:complete len:322 (-) Transcript_51752:75-1040(-)
MARIARRWLRLKEVPIFSLPSPWTRISDAQGECPFILFDARYVEMARRIEPPQGKSQFGYTQAAQRCVGGTGMLLRAGPLEWQGPREKGPVNLVATQQQPFRILSLRKDDIAGMEGAPPLTIAHVQLLHIKDIQRDIGKTPSVPPHLTVTNNMQLLHERKGKLPTEGARPTGSNASIFGHTYVQWGEVGFASYHFEKNGEAYISYESPFCNGFPSLDDGSPLPQRKWFTQPTFDEETRTFRGVINWDPTSFKGAVCWEYEMLFSEDLSRIQAGHIRKIPPRADSNTVDAVPGIGESPQIDAIFGRDLLYTRMQSEAAVEEQ